jgi:hypothetical protein
VELNGGCSNKMSAMSKKKTRCQLEVIYSYSIAL